MAASEITPEQPEQRRGPYGLAGRLHAKSEPHDGPAPVASGPSGIPGIMSLNISLDSFGRSQAPAPAKKETAPAGVPAIRQPGRKVAPIPADAEPALAALAEFMRSLRTKSNLTLKQLSVECNYSEAALSLASSGKSVPHREIVEAFARGCRASASEMREVRWLWTEADRNRPGSGGIRPADPGGSGSGGGGARSRRHRPEPPTAEQLGTLVALVREAAHEENRAEFRAPDPIRTALTLCTTPDDFVTLLEQVMNDRDLELKEMPTLADRRGLRLRKADLDAVFDDTQLPSTETLHAFLTACGLRAEQTELWHRHVVRLKIAQIRNSDTAPAPRGLRRTLRRHYQRPATMILLGMLTACVQIVIVLLPRLGR